MSKQDLEASMQKSVESTQRMFNTIRTGRANSSLLDRISVEYYGADTQLKSLATLTTPDSQTIQIQPFDISSLAGIEKAIAMSELGFTPNNDGKIIRINVPPLTEERRKEFCKLECHESFLLFYLLSQALRSFNYPCYQCNFQLRTPPRTFSLHLFLRELWIILRDRGD